MVMAKVQEKFRIPRLRKTIEKIISRFHRCKKFCAFPPGLLPYCRTEQSTPLNVFVVDFL